MTREELEALVERVWFGQPFRVQVVDATIIKVFVDVRAFWPGGPRSLCATVRITDAMTPGEVVIAMMEGAGTALAHELQEQTTVDGMRWASPHPVGLFRVSRPVPSPSASPTEGAIAR